ncbi:endonuclease domain-containing protein [Jiella endophytica]
MPFWVALLFMAMHAPINPKHRRFAKRMRLDPTPAERAFWYGVKAVRLGGLKFRRQVPMLGFIVDFVCYEAKLIVEIDGWQHDGTVAARSRDTRRDAAFAEAGYLTLRFANETVLDDVDKVLATVLVAARSRIERR